MRVPTRSVRAIRPSLCFVLLSLFFAVLWLAGGASKPDASGQIVVRGVAWTMLALVALVGPRPSFDDQKGIWCLFCLTALLPVMQLIPMPPQIWSALPGRSTFIEAAVAAGQAQPWRPLSITPGATSNALASLVVPAVTLVLLSGLEKDEHRWLPGLLLLVLVASMLIGLLQFSGAGIVNPLVDDTPGEVAGSFANRNHFALFMALGCLVAPVWAFHGRRMPGWRAPVAVSLVMLFALTVIATGSRAGLLVELLALCLGSALVWRPLARSVRRYPRWVFLVIVIGIVGSLVIVVLMSVFLDRAVSIDRVLGIDAAQDRRTRAMSTILKMISTYFPAGSGLGGFDPLFRLHEPFRLLEFTYLNHAHNDPLEIILDAGLPGGLLLLGALCWWAVKSVGAWRADSDERNLTRKLGSAILLLIVIASCFDYPARTPMMMSWIILAAVWLGQARAGKGRQPTLPLDR